MPVHRNWPATYSWTATWRHASGLVLFSLPPEFKSGNSVSERANGAFYSREYVPQGESLDHWTQMIELTGTQDLATNPEATPRALPWPECPQAAASASRLVGQPVGELRDFVRQDLSGTTTCTHLNDLLRSLADVATLAAILGERVSA